jgi:hypothetical protein
MECDQDFSIIEKLMKKNSVFFSDDENKIVAKASLKFIVIWMGIGEFVLLQPESDVMKDSFKGLCHAVVLL